MSMTAQVSTASGVSHVDADVKASGNSLGIWSMRVAFIALVVGLPMGLFQAAERSGLFPWLESTAVYFASTTTHGVLLAFVLTTFFAMGFGYHTMAHSINKKAYFGWIGFGSV